MFRRLAPLAALLVACTFATPASAFDEPGDDPRPRTAIDDVRIVLMAMDRGSDWQVGGLQQIYTIKGDGTGIRQLTSPSDGNFYDWAVWAFNGTKIVFTQRSGAQPGGEEAIWMMDPDGSNRRKLTSNPWRNAQPKVSPDGRSLVFASIWEEAPQLAIFKLDLATLQVQNLTARGGGTYAFESDPNFSADGSSIVFAYSGGRNKETKTKPTQIWTMNADGTGAHPLTTDAYYNTDPVLSPDGRLVAISSFRGEGVPRHAWPPQSASDVFLHDWQLVVRDLVTGEDRTLTQGNACTAWPKTCSSEMGPAWVPKWSPDGKKIGYLTVRSPIDSGISIINADGSDARILVELGGKSITWWDWTDGRKTAADDAVAAIGTAVSGARLLYTAAVFDEVAEGAEEPDPGLFTVAADGWTAKEIKPQGSKIVPAKARWTPDHRSIVFTARVRVDRKSPRYAPAPPAGEERHAHFTLRQLDTVAESLEMPRASGDAAEEQVFMMKADGSDVRQLTTPWTEDYLDAIPLGDARGNTDPDVSPDGRYVIFTNVSTFTQESFVLRMDLTTGEVINLTSMTAGAVPVADGSPRFSPDGGRIAFASSFGRGIQICVMRSDGTDLHVLTDDDWVNVAPAWSPDGQSLVYSSYHGESPVDDLEDTAAPKLPLKDWFAATIDVAKGTSKTVVGADRLVLHPQWTPDGAGIAFVSVGSTGQPDIWVVGRDGDGLRPLRMTIRSKEFFFDWR